MPKRVDHAERRRELTEALWRLAEEHGLEGVSLGQVATEAGVSKGLVQHYFRSRDEMLLFATTHLRERIERRIADGGVPTLRAMLVALLPIDDARRREAFVATAFLIRAQRDPAMAERVGEGRALLRRAVAERVAALPGAADATVQATVEADILLALVSGLSEGLLRGHHTPEAAVALLDHHLLRLGA